MEKNLILPIEGVKIEYKNGERLYYLAGLDGNWQKEAIMMLTKLDPSCIIACPSEDEDLCKKSIQSSEVNQSKIKHQSIIFISKSAWKNYYMEQASYYGSVVFWFDEIDTREIINPAVTKKLFSIHADLGKWVLKSANPDEFSLSRGIYKSGKVNVVIGASDNYISSTDLGSVFESEQENKNIHKTLEATIKSAIELAKRTCPFPSLLPG